MRWPLKNQILVRMLLLLMLTIAAITFANIRSVIAVNRARQLEQNQKIAELLTTTRFPLTSSVLESMKALSGAEFAVVGPAGEFLGRTSAAPNDSKLFQLSGDSSLPNPSSDSIAANKIRVDGAAYYHSIVRTRQEPDGPSPNSHVHIFIPRQTELSIWWAASKTPLLIAALVLPLACLIGLALASHVTRPLARLKHQVQRIAAGEVFQLPPTSRDDEIRDLNTTVNELATQLQNHDEQLRQNERLRTMVQFGSGVAHHLRNSATGCQLAVELLALEHQGISETETYQVAIRQIGLMNNYIKKFLLLSKSPGGVRMDEIRDVEIDKALDRVVFLLRPSAKHLGVELVVTTSDDRPVIQMTEEDAEQLMINLISNAITAASSNGSQGNSSTPSQLEPCPDHNDSTRSFPQVRVELFRNPTGRLVLRVTDNGPGPPPEIAQDLFEPFVTGSREGTGLGLSLVREIADRVQGAVDWRRDDSETVFTFRFGHTGDAEGDMQ